jgi:acetylornithine deacetylase
MNTAIEKRVLTEIDARFGDTIDFLRSLARQPSTLGNEEGAQELVFARMKQIGLTAEKWDLDLDTLRRHPSFGPLDLSYVNRPNVTASWPAAAPGGRSVIFNGHIDVVSPEPLSNWSYGPWDATVAGDWIYGRGAGDMKAGVAAMLLAVEAVRGAGCRLRGEVIVESVIEEECTGNGTLACALRGLRADAAITPEPHTLRASLATVGVIWFRVRTRGMASHVLAADSAVNAIEKMFTVITSLRELEATLNAEARHPHYRDVPHPINLNIGIIKSGDWPSTVPSECTLECRLSCLPGVSVDQTQARVRDAVTAGVAQDPWLCENPPEVEFFGFRAEPSVVDPTSPSMQMLVDCHMTIVGAPLVFYPGTATTDQRFFINNLGMPATSYGPAAEKIHAGNERVAISSIKQTAQVLALYLLGWCGIAE